MITRCGQLSESESELAELVPLEPGLVKEQRLRDSVIVSDLVVLPICGFSVDWMLANNFL